MKYLSIAVIFCLLIVSDSLGQTQYLTISGVVKSDIDGQPIGSCTVSLQGQELNTAANYEGEFEIKIPQSLIQESLIFSSIGYQSKVVPISDLDAKQNTVILKEKAYLLDDVQVSDPKLLVTQALERKAENYLNQPEILTSFYREMIRKGNKYVDLSQGMVEFYKEAYDNSDVSMVKINKGYRSKSHKKSDTLIFKLQGGLNSMLQLDLVKNPGEILSLSAIDNYEYNLVELVDFNGSLNYKISFKSIDSYQGIRYQGLIFIDQKSMGFTSFRLGYDDIELSRMSSELVKKKPLFAKLDLEDAYYQADFFPSKDAKWYLGYAKVYLQMKVNWKKKLFNNTFYASSEMVTTGKKVAVSKSGFNSQKRDMIFSDEAPKYNDPSYWGDDTIIKPEQDVLKALKKIGKQKL